MSTAILKPARMELKTTPDAKELLTQAALLDGMDLSAFVLSSAIDKARKVVAAHAVLALSKSGQLALTQLLHNPPTPTPAMLALMAQPDLPARK